MKILRTLLAATAAFLFAGCLQVDKLVSVKADGSGTITETVVMPKAMIEQMKQMMDGLAKGFGGDAAPPADGKPAKGFDLLDEKKLREEAAKMGQGVTFVSAKKVTTASGEGYTAVYAFTDISKVKLDQNPGSAMPDSKDGPMKMSNEVKREEITFQFTKGKPAKLVINSPQMEPKAPAAKEDKPAAGEKDAAGEEMAMMMAQQMLKDMRVTVAIEVAGKIVKTNAEHVTGSKATLMEMDFNKLLANPAKFKELTKADPKTLAETKALMKGIDGIKAESQPKVTIEFQ